MSLQQSENTHAQGAATTPHQHLQEIIEGNEAVLRIRENQGLIQKVLRFWFGQNTPDESQKKLWMIAAQSVEHRKQVDAEIVHEFVSLLLELSLLPAHDYDNDDEGQHEENDNGHTKSGIRNNNNNNRWQEWCNDSSLYGYQGKLAAIIVLDQFSRHIHRLYAEQVKETNDSSTTLQHHHHHQEPLADQSIMDHRALETAQLLIQEHAGEIQSGMLPTPMYIFALMPFRHAHQIETVKYVQEQVEVMANLSQQSDAMIQRFRKATNRRLAVLQDEARRTGGGSGGGSSSRSGNISSTAANASTPSGNSNQDDFVSDDDILEMAPFDADMGPATQHVVQVTIRQFLADRGIFPIQKNMSQLQKQHQHQVANQGDHAGDSKDESATVLAALTPMIVSLSGGVDSMVIASVLQHLVKTQNYPLDIYAVHIDYANRPESRAEAEYVERWCQNLGISFVCRRIDEVTRGVTARDAYEKISRDVRYDLYRKTVQQAASDYCNTIAATRKDPSTPSTGTPSQPPVIGVVLGHHRGDLRENVLSNAHKGCGPLDLSGMTAESRNNGVTLYRPLLPLEKSYIFDYAHTFGIPYFRDTTPHWSTRGKLRNKLLPLLQEIYGDGSLNNLSNLAVESDECRALLHNVCIGPFLDQVVSKPMGITFCTTPWKHEAMFFWKFVLREALHAAGLGMFTDKAVAMLVQRSCRTEPIQEGWLQCRKDYAVHIQSNGQVTILYPTTFPWSKKDQYAVAASGQKVDYGRDGVVQVGPWTVMAELVSDESVRSNQSHVNALLEQKALKSMSIDDLLQGSISYYVQVPTWENKETGAFEPRPLVFAKFNKKTRPRAWKGVDVKIQETLPLLGNDHVALKALGDPEGCGNTHTNKTHTEQHVATVVIENPKYLARVSLNIAPT